MKTQVVRARVNPKIKADSERVLRALGLTISEAINLLLHQIKLRKGLPFDVCMPNAETQKVLDETDVGKADRHPCKDLEDLYGQLEIDDC